MILVLSTYRTGSTNLCKQLSKQYAYENLDECFHESIPDVHKNALGADVGLFANNANNLKTATANTSTRLETSITQDTPSEENATKKQLAKIGNVILNKPGSDKEPTVFDTVKKSALGQKFHNAS